MNSSALGDADASLVDFVSIYLFLLLADCCTVFAVAQYKPSLMCI